MNILVWIAQILLALVFTSVGVMKVSLPITKLSENMAWVNDFPSLFVRLLGILELILGLLIILPRIMKDLPLSLTIYSGYGMVALMIGAMAVHIKRGEFSFVVMNVVILGLAAFVLFRIKALI